MEIYKKTGITSYSFSTSGQSTCSSYYFIKEAFRYQKPKVVFLEIGETFSGKKFNTELNIRRAIDSLKLSKNKLEMICDEDYELSNFDKLSCIFPIIRYHSRWSSIGEGDIRKFIVDDNYTYKGYLLEKNIKNYKGTFNKKSKEKLSDNEEKIEEDISKIPDEVISKLEKIINLCNEENCQLVFIKIPEPTTWSAEKNRIISEYANEKGIRFIDLNYESSINIDWQKDTQDEGNHLNVYGAEKVGEYLCNYMQANFELEDHRNDIDYQDWNELLIKYENNKAMKND